MVFLIQRIALTYFPRQPFHHLPCPVYQQQHWESITRLHRKLNTHSHYISPACNDSDQHPEIQTHTHTHMLAHKQKPSHTHKMTVFPDFQRSCTLCSAKHLCTHTWLSESGCYYGEDAEYKMAWQIVSGAAIPSVFDNKKTLNLASPFMAQKEKRIRMPALRSYHPCHVLLPLLHLKI